AGLALTGVGIAGSAAVLMPAVPVWTAFLAWGVAGLGVGLAYSTISLAVLEASPADQVGTTGATMQLANVLGEALGTGLGGVLIAYASTGGRSPQAGIAAQDLAML